MEQLPPILSHPFVLLSLAILGPLVKDVVKALLRGWAKRVRADKDPANDGLADAADAVADGLDKVPSIPLVGKK